MVRLRSVTPIIRVADNQNGGLSLLQENPNVLNKERFNESV